MDYALFLINGANEKIAYLPWQLECLEKPTWSLLPSKSENAVKYFKNYI